MTGTSVLRNSRVIALTIAIFAGAVSQAHPAQHLNAAVTPQILITALHGRQWQVRYDFDAPVTQLVFARSPDRSRVETWLPDLGFEIVGADHGEVARKTDGSAFSTVRFRMDPSYRVLPKDYAPFSPFGDGSMLFHTGRFFACAAPCHGDARWTLRLWAAPDDNIVFDSRMRKAEAQWIDSGAGRSVYVGANAPLRTADLIAVVDRALPPAIRAALLSQLPQFMHGFAERLGSLPAPPMLFASYDTTYQSGWGRQGGTLSGQVFVHFYGPAWPAEIEKPQFAHELAWHFAHEAAHLYQQTFSADNAQAWIHEGAAEAFAALALRNRGAAQFVEGRIAAAERKCREQRAGRSTEQALAEGTFDVAYTCGLAMHLQVDAAIRSGTSRDGLYAVWRAYVDLAHRGRPIDENTFIAAVEQVGNRQIADQLRNALSASQAGATP